MIVAFEICGLFLSAAHVADAGRRKSEKRFLDNREVPFIMARRKRGGTGTIILVVFLVFFILLSTGLGVSTYLGFSQDDDKAKQIADEKAKTGAMEKERDWYRFQSLQYRAYMDMEQFPPEKNPELADMRGRFDAGALTNAKDGAEIKKLIVALDKTTNWDNQRKTPASDYNKLLQEARGQTEAAKNASRQFQIDQEKEKKRADLEAEKLAKANEEHDQAYKKLQAESEANLKKLLADNQALEEEKAGLSNKLKQMAEGHEKEKAENAKLVVEKDKTINGLLAQKQKLNEKIAEVQKSQGPVSTADLVHTDWKVLRTDGRGESVYINLGSADKVKPKLTFRVHGIGADGRPLPKDKATIEVMTVLDAHVSQAKIFYDREPRDNPRHDPTHNPVVQGDVIINPAWNPNLKRHIAIAGLVNLSGSGRDETEQLVRTLERQDIVVDAYLDIRKDFTIKGPGITVQTDFLIIGDTLGDDPTIKDTKAKIDAQMALMQAQAKENGVQIRGLRQFLEEIGYHLSGHTENKPTSVDVKGEAAPMQQPQPKDDKPLPAPVPNK